MSGKLAIPTTFQAGPSPWKKLKKTRYHADGRKVALNKRIVDPEQVKKVEAAQTAARKKGPVNESKAFDVMRFRPLAGFLLLRREMVDQEDGVAIPESAQKEVPFPMVVVVGGNGCEFKQGDRVVFKRDSYRKKIMLGEESFFLAKSRHVIARAEV